MACHIAHSHGLHGQTTCAGCDWTLAAARPAGTHPISIEHGKPCPACGKELKKFAWHERCHYCGTLFNAPDDPTLAAPPPPPPGTRLYRVVTQRDEFFKSSFNPAALAELLNRESLAGWRVVSMTATDVGSFLGSFWGKGGGSSRQELVILLEKIAE